MVDVTYDGNNPSSYDAEGRPVTVNSISVLYDALNRPLEMNQGGTYTQTVYSPTGEKFAFMNGSTVQKYFVPFVGGVQAVYNGSGLQYFRQPDWLGSVRWATAANGSVYYDGAYAPFGENYAEMGTHDRSFTGQTQDTVVGSYDFLFRQYRDQAGRWQVPDPAGLAAVDINNPQTWNRYAYVINNPLSYVDPLGLKLPVCSDERHCAYSYTDAGALLSWGSLMSADFWGREGNDSTTLNSVYYSLNFGGGGSGPSNPGASVCNSIPSGGTTVQVPLSTSPQAGTIGFQFNGQGNLIGLGISLTTTTPVSMGNVSVPANTVAGFTLLSPGTVQFGFNNPVQVGSGVAQAYVQTLTFSGGKYTSATGALAPFGIPLGSSNGSSSLLPWILNGNAPFSSSVSSQANQFGNLLTGLATLVSKSVSCQSLFGGHKG